MLLNIAPADLEGLTPDQIIAKFGGDERAAEILQWCRYNSVVPQESRTDFMSFVRYLHPHADHYENADKTDYDTQPHHELLGEVLTEVIDGKCRKVCISMPPQSGKSELGTRMFLPYHMGRFPKKHLLMAAYNQDFAEEFGDEVRHVINTPEYKKVFPEMGLRQGSKAKDHMVTLQGGKISFLGREGSGTGRPADGFLMDDMIKGAKEAESKTTRNDIWNFFTRVANNRCHIQSWQVIIMTRWSDDDVIARLTDPKNKHYKQSVAKQWTVINIPAIMDNPDIAKALGKKVGDALWPARFPLEHLATAREMDPYGFNALQMGRPTPPEGAFYKVNDIYEYHNASEFPKNARMYLTGDLAVSPELWADKSCVGTWGLDENDVLWLHPDLYWERKSSDESVTEIIERGKLYKIMEAYFEKGQLDRAIGPFLEKAMREAKAYFSVTSLPVAGNKGVRSLSIRGRMREGKVRFPAFAPWWPAAKDQLLKFTGSGADAEDDFCDMNSLIGQALEDTIAASKPSSNVVNFPKVGTFGWTKWASNQEKRLEMRLKNRNGM
jgi:predicted phage terminase large subunit-like protein